MGQNLAKGGFGPTAAIDVGVVEPGNADGHCRPNRGIGLTDVGVGQRIIGTAATA